MTEPASPPGSQAVRAYISLSVQGSVTRMKRDTARLSCSRRLISSVFRDVP
jgi:hypothetical protein